MNIENLKKLIEQAQGKSANDFWLATGKRPTDVIVELAKAQEEKDQEIERLLELVDKYIDYGTQQRLRAEAAEQQLQKPEKGEVLVTVSGFTGCGKSAVAGEIEIALCAIGLPVTWTNGDAEKRMTSADWLTALEMYKPRVRIVEQNIARTAGNQEQRHDL